MGLLASFRPTFPINAVRNCFWGKEGIEAKFFGRIPLVVNDK